MSHVHAGAAKADITPYAGAFLAGFGGRDHGSQGVHDGLFARAVVLRAGDDTAAIVSCDLIGLTAASVAAIRAMVERDTGVPGDRVLVACTHTHSGPTMGCLRHPGLDLELVHVTERAIAGAVVQAWRSLGEAALGSGLGRVAIGINRRERRPDGSTRIGQSPEGPVDPTVAVLRLDGADGRPAAILVSHACHPVVLGGGNYLVSADYPGQMAAFLERACPGAVCGFLQGTCGDINPVPVGGTFEDARRLGTILGAEALKVAAGIATRADVSLAVARRTVQAPLAPLPPAEELRALAATRSEALDAQVASGALPRQRADADYQVAWARAALAEHGKPRPQTARALELLAMRLGELLLIGTPGETFVELGAAVRAASPLPHTVVVGYANGNVGYLPTARAFAEGGYEVETAHKFYRGTYGFAPGVEHAVTSAAIELARELGARRQQP